MCYQTKFHNFTNRHVPGVPTINICYNNLCFYNQHNNQTTGQLHPIEHVTSQQLQPKKKNWEKKAFSIRKTKQCNWHMLRCIYKGKPFSLRCTMRVRMWHDCTLSQVLILVTLTNIFIFWGHWQRLDIFSCDSKRTLNPCIFLLQNPQYLVSPFMSSSFLTGDKNPSSYHSFIV